MNMDPEGNFSKVQFADRDIPIVTWEDHNVLVEAPWFRGENAIDVGLIIEWKEDYMVANILDPKARFGSPQRIESFSYGFYI